LFVWIWAVSSHPLHEAFNPAVVTSWSKADLV
jgi:hypothetical protein